MDSLATQPVPQPLVPITDTVPIKPTFATPSALTIALSKPLTEANLQVAEPQVALITPKAAVEEPVVIILATAAATPLPTVIVDPTATSTPVPSLTPTPVPTKTPSATPTATNTATPTATPTPTFTPTPGPLDRTTNILILGSDRREGDGGWRTDVIMIVALDTANARAGIISIPRDVYLDEIPGHKPNRINVVDVLGQQDDSAGGGPALLATILAEKLGVRTDYYVRFEFESFKELVDALGGVRISLDCPVSDEIEAEDLVIDLPVGEHLLDGKEALAFVRTRRQGGDLARVRRQQQLVWAIRQQMLAENWLPRVPALYSALSESVQTDIGVLKTVDLARVVMNLNEERIYGFTLASPDLIEPAWRNGMSIFLVDWAAAANDVQSIFERAQFEDESGTSEISCP